MDLNMPEKDGYETAKEIKEFCLKHDIVTAIICTSAYFGQEDKQKAFECGMDDCVSKPIMK